MSSAARRVIAVIPAYNEAATLRAVVSGVLLHLGDVIVVDDGSGDNTAGVVADLPVRLIRHERNLGKSRSLMDGFRAALESGADAVVTLDGDGQHLPQDLPKLLTESAQYPAAIVIGSRLHDKSNIPGARYRANRFANFWIAWAAGYPICDSQSGCRVYPAATLRLVLEGWRPPPRFVFESEVLILAARHRIFSRPVQISAIYASGGRQSHFRPVRDIALITLMVARHLLSRGLHLPGLVASLRRHPAAESTPAKAQDLS
jgi:glycosyltransferase involved in cell wall biosynthesis